MIILRLSSKMSIKMIVTMTASVAFLEHFQQLYCNLQGAPITFNFVVNIKKPIHTALVHLYLTVTLFKCEIWICLNNFCTIMTVSECGM